MCRREIGKRKREWEIESERKSAVLSTLCGVPRLITAVWLKNNSTSSFKWNCKSGARTQKAEESQGRTSCDPGSCPLQAVLKHRSGTVCGAENLVALQCSNVIWIYSDGNTLFWWKWRFGNIQDHIVNGIHNDVHFHTHVLPYVACVGLLQIILWSVWGERYTLHSKPEAIRIYACMKRRGQNLRAQERGILAQTALLWTLHPHSDMKNKLRYQEDG